MRFQRPSELAKVRGSTLRSSLEVAKALGGSFKLVTLAPKTVREMTHCSEGSF